jgi:ABC-type amino acid transport system permease subunit
MPFTKVEDQARQWNIFRVSQEYMSTYHNIKVYLLIMSHYWTMHLPITVAARPKASIVFYNFNTDRGFESLWGHGFMFVFLLCFYVKCLAMG